MTRSHCPLPPVEQHKEEAARDFQPPNYTHARDGSGHLELASSVAKQGTIEYSQNLQPNLGQQTERQSWRVRQLCPHVLGTMALTVESQNPLLLFGKIQQIHLSAPCGIQ